MKMKLTIIITAVMCLGLAAGAAFAQKIETEDGIRVIHNPKSGKWGNSVPIFLEVVGTIGQLEAVDENLAFYMPSDIAFDGAGNSYVLDSGNQRVQKFDSEGTYLATLGRKGQGPGEYAFPGSLEVTADGTLYVSDSGNQRIQISSPDGKEHKTITMLDVPPGNISLLSDGRIITGAGGSGLSFGMGDPDKKDKPEKLFKVVDAAGKLIEEFGEGRDYKHFLLNRMGNAYHYTMDGEGAIYVAFDFQNRIEKYSPDGGLLWRADRKLNYSTAPPKAKGSMQRGGGMVAIEMPDMNRCGSGIAVDAKGRIWVVGLKRQIEEEEKVGVNVEAMQDDSGARSMSMKAVGNTDIRESDAYVLEVYAPDGILLGKIPVQHFVDDIHIHGDHIFLLDRMRGMQFRTYRIVEN